MAKGGRIAGRVAQHMWESDGRPELHPDEPTAVGLNDYKHWTLQVVLALLDLPVGERMELMGMEGVDVSEVEAMAPHRLVWVEADRG